MEADTEAKANWSHDDNKDEGLFFCDGWLTKSRKLYFLKGLSQEASAS